MPFLEGMSENVPGEMVLKTWEDSKKNITPLEKYGFMV